MINAEIFKSKTGFMQRICDWVRVGYFYWTMGNVSYDKSEHLVRKFQRNYFVAQDKNQRFRAKKNGEGCAKLLLWESAPQQLTWVLLVSEGEHPAHQLENLRNALEGNGRISLTGYELIRYTRVDAARPSWTWRMTTPNYEDWRLRIIRVCRSGNALAHRQAIFSLYHTPGFAQCRSQVGKLMYLFRGEWQRSRSSQPFPEVPAVLPYVRRFTATTISLSAWLNDISKVTVSAQPVKLLHTKEP